MIPAVEIEKFERLVGKLALEFEEIEAHWHVLFINLMVGMQRPVINAISDVTSIPWQGSLNMSLSSSNLNIPHLLSLSAAHGSP